MTMLTDSCLRRNLIEALVHSRGQLNLTGYSNADVDALINRAQATNDLDTRRRLYAEAEQKTLDDAVLVPVWWTLAPRSYPARATASDRGVTVNVTAVTLDRELSQVVLTVENGTDTELDLLPILAASTVTDEWGKTYGVSATGSTLPSQVAPRSSRSGNLAFRGVRVGAVKLQLTLPGIRVGDETLTLRLDVSPP